MHIAIDFVIAECYYLSMPTQPTTATNRIRRDALMREFQESLPELAREFTGEELSDEIQQAFEDYETGLEKWNVIAERNTRIKETV